MATNFNRTGKVQGASSEAAAAVPADGACSNKDELKAAAGKAGKAGVLDQFARDYPVGRMTSRRECAGLRQPARRPPHAPDGKYSLGLRCCVYGLTFTSHFYGAKRSVGYVPFNSETLVTGKLFEDIRDAVHEVAKPEDYDAVIVTNLCVPTASGVPLQILPKEINGVRVIGIDVPGFGVPTHAEAKDVLAGAMLRYAAGEIRTRSRGAAQDHIDLPP